MRVGGGGGGGVVDDSARLYVCDEEVQKAMVGIVHFRFRSNIHTVGHRHNFGLLTSPTVCKSVCV